MPAKIKDKNKILGLVSAISILMRMGIPMFRLLSLVRDPLDLVTWRHNCNYASFNKAVDTKTSILTQM